MTVINGCSAFSGGMRSCVCKTRPVPTRISVCTPTMTMTPPDWSSEASVAHTSTPQPLPPCIGFDHHSVSAVSKYLMRGSCGGRERD